MKKRKKITIHRAIFYVSLLMMFAVFVLAIPGPILEFIGQTLGNNTINSDTSVFINVSVTNGSSTFLDWDNFLIYWLRIYNSSDYSDHSYYNPESNPQYVEGGVWTWFNDPRAIYYKNLTITGWVGIDGSIIVWQYNHITNVSNSTLLKKEFQENDHDNPVFVILPDDKIMVLYSQHNGQSYYRISSNLLDTTSWGTEHNLLTAINESATSYMNAFYLSNEGLIFLSYRRPSRGVADWNRGIATYNYTNGTWTMGETLFAVSGERPYIKYWSNDKDRIDFLMTNGHPNKVAKNNVYHFYYQRDNYYKSDGTLIGNDSVLPLTPDNVTMVYNASITDERAWVWDIAVNNGIPYATYALVENKSNHMYRYAFFNESSGNWENYNITEGLTDLYPVLNRAESEYSGGVVLDSKNISDVYLSKATQTTDPKIFEIQKWSTNNNGQTWINTENLTTGSSNKNFRPSVIKNYSSDLKVLWVCGFYTTYSNYDTEICSDSLGEISTMKKSGKI
ncbi:MAG: BNR-4 repeat-containing protein [Nanoarchaeota archaeon]